MDIDPNLGMLFREFAGVVGLPSLRLDNEGACALRVDGRTVQFQVRAPGEELLIFSKLGPLAESQAAALAFEMLQANLFGRETAGAVLALEGEEAIIFDCRPWKGLSAASLSEWALDFTKIARVWGERLAAPEAASFEQPEESGTPFAIQNPSFIIP